MPSKPNLFVIGERKCGTTYLCRTLDKHPEIFFPKKLETNFFNGRGQKDINVLIKDHYRDANPSLEYWGEGSTPSFQGTHAIDHITNLCGEDIQVFFALRHPIDRLVSHFYHDVKRNARRNVQTLDDGRYIERSTYAKHARRWIDRLGRERVHPLKYENLVHDANAYILDVTTHLELDPLPNFSQERQNTGYSIVRTGDSLHRINGTGPSLSFSQLSEIHKSMMPDIRETEKITGLDLSDWNEMPVWPSVETIESN